MLGPYRYFLLVLFLIVPQLFFADSYSDDFDSGISSFYWTTFAPGNLSTITASGGEVVMTQGNDVGIGLEFNYIITGDFDAQVDYQLINWPVNNQERIGIMVNPPNWSLFGIGAVERLSDDGFVSGNEGYLTHFLNGITSTPTSDTEGTLRLNRTGNTVTGYYLDGLVWQEIASYTSPDNTQTYPLFLAIWYETVPSIGIEVAFDNFSLNAPDMDIPSIPITYELDVSVTDGHGTIVASPPTGPYDQGTVVNLTAQPDSGYRVKAWTGTDDDTSEDNANTVTMSADHTVTVEFEQIPTNKGGGGGGGCTIYTDQQAPSLDPLLILLVTFALVIITRRHNYSD